MEKNHSQEIPEKIGDCVDCKNQIFRSPDYSYWTDRNGYQYCAVCGPKMDKREGQTVEQFNPATHSGEAAAIYKAADRLASWLSDRGVGVEYDSPDNYYYCSKTNREIDPSRRRPSWVPKVTWQIIKAHSEFYRDYYYEANRVF